MLRLPVESKTRRLRLCEILSFEGWNSWVRREFLRNLDSEILISSMRSDQMTISVLKYCCTEESRVSMSNKTASTSRSRPPGTTYKFQIRPDSRLKHLRNLKWTKTAVAGCAKSARTRCSRPTGTPHRTCG